MDDLAKGRTQLTCLLKALTAGAQRQAQIIYILAMLRRAEKHCIGKDGPMRQRCAEPVGKAVAVTDVAAGNGRFQSAGIAERTNWKRWREPVLQDQQFISTTGVHGHGLPDVLLSAHGHVCGHAHRRRLLE